VSAAIAWLAIDRQKATGETACNIDYAKVLKPAHMML
jgi:hypothetical protein